MIVTTLFTSNQEINSQILDISRNYYEGVFLNLADKIAAKNGYKVRKDYKGIEKIIVFCDMDFNFIGDIGIAELFLLALVLVPIGFILSRIGKCIKDKNRE